jgi:hypothetical protein
MFYDNQQPLNDNPLTLKLTPFDSKVKVSRSKLVPLTISKLDLLSMKLKLIFKN